MMTVGFFYLLSNQKDMSNYGQITAQHIHNLTVLDTDLVLTIVWIPFSPSLMESYKAEHRNCDEDGQDNITGNNAQNRPHVY